MSHDGVLQTESTAQPPVDSSINWLLVLRDLSKQVNLVPEAVDKTVNDLLAQLVESIGADAAAIWMQEPSSSFLHIYASSGLSDRFLRFFNNTDRIKTGAGLVGTVMNSRTPHFFNTLEEYQKFGTERWSDMLKLEGVTAALVVPLYVGEELYGTFNLYYRHNHAFSAVEISFAETFANQMAVIFENKKQSEALAEDSRLYKKQRDELMSIQSVVRSVDATIYSAKEQSISELGSYIEKAYRGCGLAILHEANPNEPLSLVGSYGLSTDQIQYLDGHHNGSARLLIEQIYRDSAPVFVTRVFTDPVVEKPWSTLLSNDRLVAFSALPMIAQHRIVGVYIVFYDHLHTCTEDEVSVLDTLGQFLAVSLENVKIFNRLNSEKRKTELMVNSLQDGLMVFNQAHELIELNPAALQLLALNELEYRQPETGALSDAATKQMAEILDAKIAEYATKEITIMNGADKKTLQVTNLPLKDEHYKTIGVMYILHDVTQEYKTRELKSNFIATVTHQMRTPLTSIRWGLDSIIAHEYGEVTVDQERLLVEMSKTNQFVLSLVNDLLNVSRAEQGQLGEFAEVNLSLVVSDVHKNESIAIKEKQIQVAFDCTDPVVPISGNAHDLKLAFQNVFDNAIKYTPEGGTILIKCRQIDDTYQISFTDSGIGISKEDQELLFNKFFRGKNAVLVETDGSGLGLYLSKKIIEAHGGSITVSSTIGKGSTFTITLPVLPRRAKNKTPSVNAEAVD